jgi:sugar O-acyltransferase (sialic acid O-acetyltransferase NeuD family)
MPLVGENRKEMKRKLLIIGAGGLGREVYGWAKQIASATGDWSVAGFLDANPAALDGFSMDCAVLGDPQQHVPQHDEVFLCAVGDPKTRIRLGRELKARGGRFVNLIHPTAIVGVGSTLGESVILCPYTAVTAHATLGDFVLLNLHATVGHDAVLGDGCTLSGHCDVTGGAHLGEGVFLGSHAVVLPKAKVGDYAVVGAGSVVLRSVPAHTTVMGVPAQTLLSHTPTRRAA